MQIFIIGTPLETAILLDNKRFHRQLSEAKIILNAIYGENGIANKIVFPCNYNRFTKSWESCDSEIVTHWMPRSIPAPAED